MKQFFEKANEAFDAKETVRTPEALIKELIRENDLISRALHDIWQYDPDVTFRHSIGTARLAVQIGREFKDDISAEELERLVGASLVHDVGKIFISREILDKSGELDDTERGKMREHVRKGFDYLKNMGALKEAEIIAGHHEDNKSYPRENGPSDNLIIFNDRRKPDPKILKLTRILSIIDIFESLTSQDRPYNKDRDVLSERERELEKFDSALERRIIRFLKEQDQKRPDFKLENDIAAYYEQPSASRLKGGSSPVLDKDAVEN